MLDRAEPAAEAGPSFRTLLVLLLAGTFAAKLWLAWRYKGFLTGDDLEIVQTAAKYALGVRYEPWALRCLFHPIVLVAPFLRLGWWLGARDPQVITWIAAIPTALFSTAAVFLTAVVALRFGLSRRVAIAATFFYASAWLALTYGSSPFPRPISTAMFLAAFYLVSSSRQSAWPALTAGVLAGAAFAVRWSEGVVLIPLCAWTAWRSRSTSRVLAVAGGFALGSLVFVGVTDWLTWGAPFKSLAAFFRIMYLERPAMAEEPIWDYGREALHWAGPILILLLIPCWKERHARPALAIFASIVVLLSLFSHKEWRYVQAAIPFLAMSAAAGWERLWIRRARTLAIAALVLAGVYGIDRTRTVLSNRSAAEIDASYFITGLRPQPRALAFLQQWAYGEHLYLGNGVEIREIEYSRPMRPRAIRDAAAGADVAGVYALFLNDDGRREFESLGFREIARFRKDRSYECIVFGRGPFAAGPRPKSGG